MWSLLFISFFITNQYLTELNYFTDNVLRTNNAHLRLKSNIYSFDRNKYSRTTKIEDPTSSIGPINIIYVYLRLLKPEVKSYNEDRSKQHKSMW